MLSRSHVRSDRVALEAIDWAMQEGVISVEQRNQIVREVARRNGSLRRQAFLSGAQIGRRPPVDNFLGMSRMVGR